MKFTTYTAAAAILAASLVVSYAQSSDSPAPAKKHAPAKKATTPPPPSVEEQIQALRSELQTQIDSLKSDLATKDAQLRQAQQDAADARAAANKAEADAQAQQQAVTENAGAVSTLQTTVTDLKTNQASLATTVSDETTNIKKAINNPDAIRFKGTTLSFSGSFLAAETVNRTSATGGDINTAFTGVPLANSDAYNVSEFYGSGRQSRLAIKARWQNGKRHFDRLLRGRLVELRYHLEQQPVQQLHACASASCGPTPRPPAAGTSPAARDGRSPRRPHKG